MIHLDLTASKTINVNKWEMLLVLNNFDITAWCHRLGTAEDEPRQPKNQYLIWVLTSCIEGPNHILFVKITENYTCSLNIHKILYQFSIVKTTRPKSLSPTLNLLEHALRNAKTFRCSTGSSLYFGPACNGNFLNMYRQFSKYFFHKTKV